MPSLDDLDLMRHADGELERDEREQVERRLADAVGDAGTTARAKVQGLSQLRELVKGHLEQSADEAPSARFETMWGRIATTMGNDTSSSRRRVPANGGLWGRVNAWLDRYRGHVITGAVSAGAVAAMALVFGMRNEDRGQLAERSGAIDVRPAAMRTAPEIESLDTPDGEGTVLNLEDEDGHTTVIWVSPADTVEGI